MVELYDYQRSVIDKLRTGSILCGGVGSGKSLTSIAYFLEKVCDGEYDEKLSRIVVKKPKDLYIITTAAKRDSKEWEGDLINYCLSPWTSKDVYGITVTIDSWNNIKKYENVQGAFFIFDEQRISGYGSWVKSFLKISKVNDWILLSATPGDTWTDYIPVFIANGFYRNKTEFLAKHAVMVRTPRYVKIDHFVDVSKLIALRNKILVRMTYKRPAKSHEINVETDYDHELYSDTLKNRWDYDKNQPIQDASGLCRALRYICNKDESKLEVIKNILKKEQKIIIFYNFNYELEDLRTLASLGITVAEHNGFKHDPIPKEDKYVYLVQYNSGAEGWNCTDTNIMVFYSENYSYKIMTQAAGRIDRVNTPFEDLYYYHLRSKSTIDQSIFKALSRKEIFNEQSFYETE